MEYPALQRSSKTTHSVEHSPEGLVGSLGLEKNAKWMILSILIPELLVKKALEEFFAARDSCTDELALMAKDNGTEWEPIHSYFANMGGFVLDFTEILDQQFTETRSDNTSALSRLAGELGSEIHDSDDKTNLQRMSHKLWALISPQILEARRLGLIQTLPQVSGRILESFNKGDILVKLLALLQVSWLIIQLIARKIARLPSSQLEIAALAFSASSIVTYLLYWSRPQGVETVWTIKASRLPTKQEMKSLVDAGPWYFYATELGKGSADDDYDLLSIPNDTNSKGMTIFYGASVGGTVFGGLHCLAWNFHFPTPAEALIWRICSIVTTLLPLVWVPVTLGLVMLLNSIFAQAKITEGARDPFQEILDGESKWIHAINLNTVSDSHLIIYALARLFLIVETFRSLFFPPPEAFIDTWSGGFPHWG